MSIESRVAVLVDCDNLQPAVLEYALDCAAGCGRVVLKRAYGNHTTLAHRWQDAIVRMAFAPCLQFQYVNGKNTSDIALALDALELFLDERADSFVIVTSDSDFVHLCHKLRERGAAIRIVGEAKTPDALRSACDRFFEFVPAETAKGVPDVQREVPVQLSAVPVVKPPVPKKQPQFVLDAVLQLAACTTGGKVPLAILGGHLRKLKPGFEAKTYGYPKLIDMLRAFPSLSVSGKSDKTCTVRLVQKAVGKAA